MDSFAPGHWTHLIYLTPSNSAEICELKSSCSLSETEKNDSELVWKTLASLIIAPKALAQLEPIYSQAMSVGEKFIFQSCESKNLLLYPKSFSNNLFN